MADRVASIEKEQKQEEGRDGASTPPPPTTEIILSDDEDEEKMDEYNAHGVSHVFELEDVFTEAVSDLDWSLDGSALLAGASRFVVVAVTGAVFSTPSTWNCMRSFAPEEFDEVRKVGFSWYFRILAYPRKGPWAPHASANKLC